MSLIKLTLTFTAFVAIIYAGQFTFDQIEYADPSQETIYAKPSSINIQLNYEDWLSMFKDKSVAGYPAKVQINDSEIVEANFRFGGQSTRRAYQYKPETQNISQVTLHGRIHRWLETNIDFKLSPFDEDPTMMRLKFGHDFFNGVFELNREFGFIPRTNYAYVSVPPAPTYLALFTEPINNTFFKVRNYPRILHKSPDRLKIMEALRNDSYPRYKDHFDERYVLTYILIEYYLNSENPLLSYGDSENYDLYFDSYSKKNYLIPNDLDAVVMSCKNDVNDQWNIFHEERNLNALANLYQNSDNKKELNYLMDAIHKKIYQDNYGQTLAEKNLDALKTCCSQFMVENHERYYKELLQILECQRQKFNRLVTLTRNSGHFANEVIKAAHVSH